MDYEQTTSVSYNEYEIEYEREEYGDITEEMGYKLENGCPVKYSYSYVPARRRCDDGRYFESLCVTDVFKKVDGAWVDVTEDEMDEVISWVEEEAGIHYFL